MAKTAARATDTVKGRTDSFYRDRMGRAAPFARVRGAVRRVLVAAGTTLALAACSRAGCERRHTTPGATVPFAAERCAYVTDNVSDTITVIDRDGTGSFSVALDLDPSAHEAPHHVAVDGARGVAFVALAFPDAPAAAGRKASRHDAHGRARSTGLLARLDLARLAVRTTVEVDENPGDVVLTPDGRRVLVTHFDLARAMRVAEQGRASPATMFATLRVHDAETLALVGERPVCVAPHGIEVTADGRLALVACYGSDELALVDLATEGLPTERVPVAPVPGVPGVPAFGPYAVRLGPDGALAAVSATESGEIRWFAMGERRFLHEATARLGARPMLADVTRDGRFLVPLQGPDGLARVAPGAAVAEKRVRFAPSECLAPHAARVARDGRAYVVCEGDKRGPSALVEVDPATLEIRRRWATGAGSDGLDFSQR